ncbi:MAG: hypothetical protein PSY12_13530 [bacterium]|nr:hypothetical protein [bacterium]
MWLPAKYPSLELSKGSVGWRGGRRLYGFNQNAMFFKSGEQSPPAAWQKGALVDQANSPDGVGDPGRDSIGRPSDPVGSCGRKVRRRGFGCGQIGDTSCRPRLFRVPSRFDEHVAPGKERTR